MAKLHGNIYAQPQAIASDLHWLQENLFVDMFILRLFLILPLCLSL
ncbi:hypothetical protein [Umezakia ovalisporum]|nr:hypothetical protein [Umezakia ovalisporum]MDH6068048.1 hypothetical protein [Umezakia ovalisporum APH033B]MDH6077138.1 hypothetical protein [Umezakia ovalisporum FSS-45]MDH6084020.1 hypothetical protein [Umezakia ovalisporum TAC611]